MARLLQVAHLGHPILRQIAEPIVNFKDQKLQELIDDMITTVMDVDGVGIAAPQVYQGKRLFIMASHPNPRYPKAPLMPPIAVINPEIKSHSKKVVKDFEGCLSIPGVRALVPRWKRIEVKYFDRKGNEINATYTDFLARIFQHELDHLDGKVFFDRLETTKDIFMEKEYLKLSALNQQK